MPEMSAITFFAIAAAVLLITPGPAVLYIIARSLSQGRMAGFVSALGVGLGTLFHVAAAALGISAVLVSSVLAFNIIKYLGAAYLIYLGIRTLLTKPALDQPAELAPKRLSKIFYQGVWVNILNPKTALFFFAFLPQFVEPARGSVALQSIFLGTLFVLMGIISDGLYALLAGSLAHWLKDSITFLKGQKYFAGTVYIALGLTTALAGGDQK